jgi:hypothetical protein
MQLRLWMLMHSCEKVGLTEVLESHLPFIRDREKPRSLPKMYDFPLKALTTLC